MVQANAATDSNPQLARYRAIVEYDGSNYWGFQRQIASQITIQSELERALSNIAQQPTQIVAAGRTDRGVHASGQVIAFNLAWRHETSALLRAFNANLPMDIVIRVLDSAESHFHPRFDAQRRAYRYTIYNNIIRSPLRHTRSWHVFKPLDLDAMNVAAQQLVGEHDFATFGQPPQGINTVRELFKASWQREGEFLWFDIEATAFLKRMVRSIVGSLKMVGTGEWSGEEFVAAFRAAERQQSGVAAPPQGLVLERVDYSDGFGT